MEMWKRLPLAKASLLLLLLRIRCYSGLAFSIVAKTSETFKLAELQYLEAKLQAEVYNFTFSRFLLDRFTGSLLLAFDNLPPMILDPHSTSNAEPPSIFRRCDWILQIFHDADSAENFVETLRAGDFEGLDSIQDGWMLDYLRLEDINFEAERAPPTYSMKTLLSSIAQSMPTHPTLNPKQYTDSLLVVDAKASSGNRIFLGRKLDVNPPLPSILDGQWSKRPFPYSSAINQNAAKIIFDVLCDRIPTIPSDVAVLLDPTCGSGTFLAVAMERGFRVEGYDINPHCVEGTQRNLESLFGKEQVRAMAHVDCRDSAGMWNDPISEPPSCVMANLPWGVNSIQYVDENYRILQSIKARLRPGTPCAFVTRNDDYLLFSKTGFEVLAQAHIPPRDFWLPKGKKKGKKSGLEDSDGRNRRNRCVVTIGTPL